MSHDTGKVEVLAVDEERIYLRYHRATDPADRGRLMIYKRDDEAYWLDQLVPVEGTNTPTFTPSPLLEVLAGPD